MGSGAVEAIRLDGIGEEVDIVWHGDMKVCLRFLFLGDGRTEEWLIEMDEIENAAALEVVQECHAALSVRVMVCRQCESPTPHAIC